MILSASSSAALRPISGLAAGSESVGQLDAELNLNRSARKLERLHVGVRNQELHALQGCVNHAVDGIAAAAADADHLDLCVVAWIFVELDSNVLVFDCLHRRIPFSLATANAAHR